MLKNPQDYFADLPDPRRRTRNKLHRLQDIVMITLCALVCGFEDWVSIEDFGCENEAWLRTFLELPNGIPSHDTLSDVMGRVKPQALEQACGAWMKDGLPGLQGLHVAVDGKSLRGSAVVGAGAAHLLTAFACEARLVLAVQGVADKSNEIPAIPELLGQLELSGAVVTIDAMGCQKEVAEVIVQAQADYVLALKDNHPQLCEDTRQWLQHCDARGEIYQVESVEKDHGRIETRRVIVSRELDWLDARQDWAGLNALVMVESTRHIKGRQSSERRYFLSSLTDTRRIAHVIRAHWSIENQQHWILDVQFGEDAHRAHKNHSATNLGLMRRMALNLLRDNDSSALSMRRRKMRAGSNLGYRCQILFGRAST